jgi:uncharacterized protein YceH (UPF0502 family)
MAGFESLGELETELAALQETGLVARLARRPGQKEDRYAQLLGGQAGELEQAQAHAERAHADQAHAEQAHAGPAGVGRSAHPADRSALEQRVSDLEAAVAELQAQLRELVG